MANDTYPQSPIDVDRAVVWFRRDLRIRVNPAWAWAAAHAREIVPLFVLDDRLLGRSGRRRRAQLLAHLHALDTELARRGGRLLVRHGRPEHAVPSVMREHGAGLLCANADVSAFAQRRDDAVEHHTRGRVHWTWGGLVQPPGSVLTASGSVPRVFTRFWREWSARPLPPEPPSGAAPPTDDPGQGLPPIDEPAPHAPGERAALRRLEGFVAERLDRYADERDVLAHAGTSALSSDLKFGTLSPVEVASVAGSDTDSARAFRRQLAWRDWYAHLLYETPDLEHRAQRPEFDAIAWRRDPAGFAAWCEGRTGYPVVDAAMRELAATGSMHNRARMIAASFLVKDLLVDWREGAHHFQRMLVDFDPAQNAGNWQWVAGTGPDAAPYFRIFNPVVQGGRFDPQGAYVRRWVPELGRLPARRVHAPWEAGSAELAAAGVSLGVDYPLPIVDHAEARARALEVYARARSRARPPDA